MNVPVHIPMLLLGLSAALGCRHANVESSSETDAGGREVEVAGSPNEDPTEAPPRKSPPPRPLAGKWWRSAVFYEIFVRSFADSNGDGIGDFRGLIERLDTLSDGDADTTDDLGVDGLWLMPIHPSPSYHGYDVTDYRSVNSQYGTLSDFKALLRAAEKRGIRVIIDFVLNHSSSEHPWFLASRNGLDAPKRDWYIWRKTPDPRFLRPWDSSPDIWHKSGEDFYYGLFWSGMPDLNLGNEAVVQEMISAMKFWLALGVDGFRVDAVRYLIESPEGVTADTPSTHALLKRIRQEIHEDYPDALLVAEAWTSAEKVAPYYGAGGDEMQLAFAFDTAGAVMTAARDGLKVSLNQTLENLLEVYEDPNFLAPFLTNHDMPRAMQQLEGDEGAARSAAATLFALPGTPFVYYGEEIGMQGGPTPADEDKRTPMRWSEEGPGYGFTSAPAPWRLADEAVTVSVEGQRADPKSLWSLYRDLIRVRRSESALLDGEMSLPRVSGGGRGTTAFIRSFENERVLYAVNFHHEASASFQVAVDGVESVRTVFQEGLVDDVSASTEGVRFGGLEGRGFAFVRLD